MRKRSKNRTHGCDAPFRVAISLFGRIMPVIDIFMRLFAALLAAIPQRVLRIFFLPGFFGFSMRHVSSPLAIRALQCSRFAN
ncbi:hypothetical protein G6M17_04105 [Agrobacterium tumefaciens]|uniref:hypothetical protein n=1 Tax=Rhizobium/Agrobacterium group TaxID=227290 RepID=UPI000987E283|nr:MULTISPECIES: hypothetical protein [Rhizobium/Agrobacterium group]AQS62358.1 hypothetical protein B0909_08975 [Rhizobium rhizogenes]MCZ7442339.1 hypothetical protein [Rhizobium rhizogenes]NSX89959.1 hypothetical protein [Agrobacterium tumefaciens]NSZ78332.1 hypothetical protein [Agrobacterium tumefaciens]UXT48270.1 hypothetical protein FY136_03080 [Agrobacterium tumefaciens]